MNERHFEGCQLTITGGCWPLLFTYHNAVIVTEKHLFLLAAMFRLNFSKRLQVSYTRLLN